jgi:hypothetical protein
MTPEQISKEMQEADRIRATIAERLGERVSAAMKAMQDGPTSGWYGKAMEAHKENKEGLERFRESGFGQALGSVYDSGMNALADVNRRVIEEPWFGKPVADILFERQQGTVHGPGRDKLEEQEEAKAEQPVQEKEATVHGTNEPQQEPQETIHGKNEPQQEQESAWDKLYGNMQAAEQEHGQDQDAGR